MYRIGQTPQRVIEIKAFFLFQGNPGGKVYWSPRKTHEACVDAMD